MNTLFDLEAIAQKGADAPPPRPHYPHRFYVYGLFDGRRYVYWKGHDNGEPEGYFLDEYPRRKPHLWKTYAGAERFARTQTNGGRVAIWGKIE